MKKEEFVRKWFRRDNLLILVLTGILLFVIAMPTKRAEQPQETDRSAIRTDDTAQTAVQQTADPVTATAYEMRQEEKLKQLLSSVEGAGETAVMLTFVSTEETVVEKDEAVQRANTVERDSEGGTRTVTQYEKQDTTIYDTSNGASIPYVVKTLYPRVDGVLVVAQGAGDGSVKQSITEAVCALFGVEPHRVKVLPMGNKHISQTGLIQ